MNIAEIRAQYPQYDDLSDEQLLQGLHQRFYSDMPYEQFAANFSQAPPIADRYSIPQVIRAKGAHGVVGGLSDEMQAAMAAPIAKAFGGEATRDMSLSELYLMQREANRRRLAEMGQEHPVVSGISEFGGGALGLGKLGSATWGATGALPKVARWGASGGIPGAVAGAGYSEADIDSPQFYLDTATGAGVGAGLGIAIPYTIEKAIQAGGPPLKRLFQRIMGKMRPVQVYDDAGQLTDEAINELRMMADDGRATPAEVNEYIRIHQAGKPLTPEQAERFNRFRRHDVRMVKPNVTQSTDDWKATQEMAKSEGMVSQTLAGQSDDMGAAAIRVQEGIGEVLEDTADAGVQLFNRLVEVRTSVDDAVNAAYQAARARGAGIKGTMNNFAKAFQRNRGHKQISGGVIESAKQILIDKGLVKAGQTLETAKRARGTRYSLKKIGVNEMQQVREALNDLWDSATPKGRRIIRELTYAIDDDVAAAAGDDLFRAANAAKTFERRLLNKAVGSRYAKTGKSLVQKIFYEDIPPAKILRASRTASRGDIEGLRRYVTALDDEFSRGGQRMWDNFRAQHIKAAIDEAYSTAAKSEGGGLVWNANKFKSYWKPMRDNGTFKTLFNEAERSMIDDLVQLGRDMQPIGRVQQGMGPSAQAIQSGFDLLISKIPYAGRIQPLLRSLQDLRTNRELTEGFMTATERALR